MAEVTADGNIIIGRSRPRNNPLIHRSEVGKPAFHNDLPSLPSDYTFGAPLKRDPEGAGEVMLTWQQHCPPQSKVAYDFGRDFLTLNKRSVQHNCINSKDVSNFRKENDARIRPKLNTTKAQDKHTTPFSHDPNHAYGLKSGESEGVADLIQNRYELEWVSQQQKIQNDADRKRQIEKDRQKGRQQRLSPVKHRPVSSLEEQEPHLRDYFTLKQFRDVPSRFRTPTPVIGSYAADAK